MELILYILMISCGWIQCYIQSDLVFARKCHYCYLRGCSNIQLIFTESDSLGPENRE